MPTDWLGISISVLIILMIIFIVIAKIQGERVIDVVGQFIDLIKGDK